MFVCRVLYYCAKMLWPVVLRSGDTIKEGALKFHIFSIQASIRSFRSEHSLREPDISWIAAWLAGSMKDSMKIWNFNASSFIDTLCRSRHLQPKCYCCPKFMSSLEIHTSFSHNSKQNVVFYIIWKQLTYLTTKVWLFLDPNILKTLCRSFSCWISDEPMDSLDQNQAHFIWVGSEAGLTCQSDLLLEDKIMTSMLLIGHFNP